VHKLAPDIFILQFKLVNIVGVAILMENMVFQLVVILLALEIQILFVVVVGLIVFLLQVNIIKNQ
jgi:hypothetical protein